MKISLNELKKMIYESIRSKTFNQQTFRTLTSRDDMLGYAMDHLEEIGEGSSRLVFSLTSKRVLKIALDEAGNAQNEAEVNAFTAPSLKPIFPLIYDFEKKYFWIISEAVRQINDIEEWESLAMISMDKFEKALHNVKRYKKTQKNVLTLNVIQAVQELGLDVDDLSNIEQWGKTVDGRLVLLDSGATNEIISSFY